jgi:ribosomal protein L11 methyltransferase
MKNIPFSILIEPKMSFGTVHHATTSLMISSLLKLNVQELNVLDMGCGTGVPAILASKKGAKSVTAIDIEEWSYKNTIENIGLNFVSNINPLHGNASLINGLIFNLILANINLTELMEDIPSYSYSLSQGGFLFLRGFFEADAADIITLGQHNNLKYIETNNKNNWASVLFSK